MDIEKIKKLNIGEFLGEMSADTFAFIIKNYSDCWIAMREYELAAALNYKRSGRRNFMSVDHFFIGDKNNGSM